MQENDSNNNASVQENLEGIVNTEIAETELSTEVRDITPSTEVLGEETEVSH